MLLHKNLLLKLYKQKKMINKKEDDPLKKKKQIKKVVKRVTSSQEFKLIKITKFLGRSFSFFKENDPIILSLIQKENFLI